MGVCETSWETLWVCVRRCGGGWDVVGLYATLSISMRYCGCR